MRRSTPGLGVVFLFMRDLDLVLSSPERGEGAFPSQNGALELEGPRRSRLTLVVGDLSRHAHCDS